MRKLFTNKPHQRGLLLLGIMLFLQIATHAQTKKPATDTVITKVPAIDTTVKSVGVPSVSKDTTIQKIVTAVSDSLARIDSTNVHKRKGTKRRKISDEEMDVLTQKIVQTSDQHQDVTNITIEPKPVNAPVSNKAPNTEAAPAASTAVINTLDPSPAFATNRENNNTIKDKTDNVQVKSGVQNQMNSQLN